MSKYINTVKVLWVWTFLLLLGACRDQYKPIFDKPTDIRISDDLRELKALLSDADFGWEMHYSFGARYVEYMLYQIATFYDDNTVSLFSGDVAVDVIKKPVISEYRLLAEDGLQLQFSTQNINWTSYATPAREIPQGLGANLELKLVSISKDKNEIIFEGKRAIEGHMGKGKMVLRRLEAPVRNFKELAHFRSLLDGVKQRNTYTTLHITAGIEGASPETPFLVGLELSGSARQADFKYNVGEDLFEGRKMLYFDHKGLGFSTPIEVKGQRFEHLRWDNEAKTFVIDGDTPLKGQLIATAHPGYHLPGLYEDFMDKFSLEVVASFGPLNRLSRSMKSGGSLIKQAIVCTQYRQRIPLIDEKGEYVYDDVYNHDYRQGELLGDGLFLIFDERDQFYGYFIPLEFERVYSDVVRFKRTDKPMQIIVNPEGDKHSPTREEAQSKYNQNRETIEAYLNYLCAERPWMIRKTMEAGRLDWDFRSWDNPREEYFITRLK